MREAMIRIRTRGQGMTEYIIIVGLVAVLCMVAVGNYRFAVDEAIQGTDGAVKGIGSTNNQYSNSGGNNGNNGNGNSANRTPAGTFNPPGGGTGEPVFNQNGTMVFANGTPLTPAEQARVN